MKEHRPDGSIVAVPCSALDLTDSDEGGSEKKKKKAKENASEDEEKVSVCKKEVNDTFQNGIDNIHKDSISQMKTQRKQTRKRGKKKKKKECEM